MFGVSAWLQALAGSEMNSHDSISAGGELSPDASVICRRYIIMRGGPMREMCNHGAIISEIMRGVRSALEECQTSMRDQRWNCSNRNSALVRLLKQETREAAYVRAMVSAGSIYSVVDGCARGSIERCDCRAIDGSDFNHGRRSRGPRDRQWNSWRRGRGKATEDHPAKPPPGSSWAWRGCDSNIRFAYKISKNFIDEPEKRVARDFKSDLHLHNHEAGRLASLRHMRKQCRCHGMSGSCVMQTCWLSLPYFSDVALRLKEAYKRAVLVTSSNKHYGKNRERSLVVPVRKRADPMRSNERTNGRHVIVGSARKKKPRKESGERSKTVGRQALVYSQDSPDFCVHDERFGLPGTAGRRCQVHGNHSGGCSSLCCGRGFRSEERIVERNCHCKFEWCCDISCSQCINLVVEHRCR